MVDEYDPEGMNTRYTKPYNLVLCVINIQSNPLETTCIKKTPDLKDHCSDTTTLLKAT